MSILSFIASTLIVLMLLLMLVSFSLYHIFNSKLDKEKISVTQWLTFTLVLFFYIISIGFIMLYKKLNNALRKKETIKVS